MFVDLCNYYKTLSEKFGLKIDLGEPETPTYDAEDIDFAKDYLKKYRLQK